MSYTTFYKKCNRPAVALLLTAALFTACKENDEPRVPQETAFTEFSIKGLAEKAVIDKQARTVYIRVPETVTNADSLVPEFKVSPGAIASINNVEQVSGQSWQNFNDMVIYTVKNPATGDKQRWYVTVTNNDFTAQNGMGNFLTDSYSDNGVGNFYVPQFNTGAFSQVNCGPAVTLMALRWIDPTYAGTVEEIRTEVPVNQYTGTELWYPNDVHDYIARQFNGKNQNSHQIKWRHQNGVWVGWYGFTGDTWGQDDYFVRWSKFHLVRGSILILSINSSVITEQLKLDKGYRANKHYTGGSGHFILIKGYKEVNGKLWYEVHDPWDLEMKRDDGSFVAASRYYKAEDIVKFKQHNNRVVILSPYNMYNVW